MTTRFLVACWASVLDCVFFRTFFLKGKFLSCLTDPASRILRVFQPSRGKKHEEFRLVGGERRSREEMCVQQREEI